MVIVGVRESLKKLVIVGVVESLAIWLMWPWRRV
jgi:hypothetical protein